MKKTKKLSVTASAIIAGLCVSGCSFTPEDNEPVDVYGPPISENTDEENETAEPENSGQEGNEEPEDDISTEVTDDFAPDENVAEPLYGPPAGDKRE